jgi:hypothetical protein
VVLWCGDESGTWAATVITIECDNLSPMMVSLAANETYL